MGTSSVFTEVAIKAWSTQLCMSLAIDRYQNVVQMGRYDVGHLNTPQNMAGADSFIGVDHTTIDTQHAYRHRGLYKLAQHSGHPEFESYFDRVPPSANFASPLWRKIVVLALVH